MSGVRLDKWLWAARFFKTRTLAAKACELGRIEADHQPARSSREVRAGDLLSIKTEGGDFQVEVLALSDMRGPASVAQTLYRETEASASSAFVTAAERVGAISGYKWSVLCLAFSCRPGENLPLVLTWGKNQGGT
jgi:ribosome-associated heat shock protein Hsp15